jgi:transposase
MAEEMVTSVESIVREIHRRTRKKYSEEKKMRIVLEGLRGEEKIAELCPRESIHQTRT